MVGRKRQQYAIYHHNMLKVIDNALAVQKVHGCPQKVPVQGLCESQTARPTWHVHYADDLLEGDNLQNGDEHYYIEVAGEEAEEEAANHYKGPYCTSDEGFLLFFEIGLWCALL